MRSCQFTEDFFSRAQRPLLQNKVFTICLQSLTNISKLRYSMFSLFYRNPKTVYLTAISNSHQTVLPKTTSYNLLQIFFPFLFMGFSLEKNEKFVNLLQTFLKASKSSFSKYIFCTL